MENSDARPPPVRRVRCPRCHSVLEEPGEPVYQCGGCGTTLRAKNRTGNTGDAVRGSPSTSRSGLPPQSRHLDSTDVASTSRSRSSTPTSLDATTSRHRATDTTSRHESGDLVSGRRHDGSGNVASTSSTPTVTSSRRQGTGTRSQGGAGDLVSGRRHGSGDVVSTSSTPTVTSNSRQGIDTTSRRESGDLVSARRHDSGEVASTSSRRRDTDTTNRQESGDIASTRNRVSEQVELIEKRGHDQSAAAANQEVFDNSEGRRPRHAGGAAERSATTTPGVSVHFPGENRDAGSELQDDTDTEKRIKRQAESPDAARKKHSGEATVQPQYHHRQEPAQSAARDVLGKEEDDAATAAGEKALSPSRQELQPENLAPLRKRILKTVDELKGDLSELFRKSPELNPTPRARPPRLPKQEGYVSRVAAASVLPATTRARHAAADVHRGSAARAAKHRQVTAPPPPPPRGLPSRRYRRCRADPYCDSVVPRSCHHGCCHHHHHHHGKPECSSCRGHCCRSRAPEPPSAPRRPTPAAKRRPAPRNHCRPVLKGAPFIICSSCFKLVQVPADFAVASKTVRKLRCGACSTVLSYSYRDPARKKSYPDSLADQLSTDGSELHGGGRGMPDPFAPFVDGFGLSSYSTDDQQPLHPSRNTSFDTMDGMTRGVGRLHRLMGYGSASELLRHSPDLYESFRERTTPDVGHYDRKGKGVCVDDNDYGVDDDSDEEERLAVRGGSGWPLPGMLGKGIIPAPGAIRIK
ncbi:unnamed protein product [Urochloa decumbens]|uniref:Zinc-ribbon domain-containing protein n=1 Tax=Urochloa decumbens TaxID=240449 RepID=A0ABC9G227_9POAL